MTNVTVISSGDVNGRHTGASSETSLNDGDLREKNGALFEDDDDHDVDNENNLNDIHIIPTPPIITRQAGTKAAKGRDVECRRLRPPDDDPPLRRLVDCVLYG